MLMISFTNSNVIAKARYCSWECLSMLTWERSEGAVCEEEWFVERLLLLLAHWGD